MKVYVVVVVLVKEELIDAAEREVIVIGSLVAGTCRSRVALEEAGLLKDVELAMLGVVNAVTWAVLDFCAAGAESLSLESWSKTVW